MKQSFLTSAAIILIAAACNTQNDDSATPTPAVETTNLKAFVGADGVSNARITNAVPTNQFITYDNIVMRTGGDVSSLSAFTGWTAPVDENGSGTLTDVPFGSTYFQATYEEETTYTPGDGYDAKGFRSLRLDVTSNFDIIEEIENARNAFNPLIDYSSQPQYHDVNSTTELDDFIMSPDGGRFTFGSVLENTNEFYEMFLNIKIYDEDDNMIQDNTVVVDKAIVVDYTNADEIKEGSYIVLTLKINEVNQAGEDINSSNSGTPGEDGLQYQWIFSGGPEFNVSGMIDAGGEQVPIDGGFNTWDMDALQVTNGVAKGFAIVIDEALTPAVKTMSADLFNFEELTEEDEVIEIEN
ncbi:hypothetical protein [Flammeovirga agarivorans]|uniref:Uncharacterized protein n=1 Tax=Flammeovirga agarivorans TaxID=2726742 RepID=A0A7X8SGK7_9BACT|nr:hypothetical protein [Flammeovirga agarivorans]NLR89865.1 hypothetical protein [Flammeovirga agarivorans]